MIKAGARVRYRRLNKLGTVVECLNENAPSDIQDQGYRYIVRVGWEYWSVPASVLEEVQNVEDKSE